jgi:hypothetical protein
MGDEINLAVKSTAETKDQIDLPRSIDIDRPRTDDSRLCVETHERKRGNYMQWLFERTIEIAAWVAMIVAWVTAVLAAMWLVQWFATLKTGADYELLMCSAKAAGAFVGFSLALGALACVDRFIYDVDQVAR